MSDAPVNATTQTYPSALSSVDAIEAEAARWAASGGFDDETAAHIAMVCREAAANAVLHGNQQHPGKQVRATFALSLECLEVRIADSGAGLDLAAVPDPLAAENLLRPSGRGLFLMRALMDEVHVRHLHPGTEVTLIKRRPTAIAS